MTTENKLKAIPVPHLFTIASKPYSMSCKAWCPDTPRVVILSERPNKINNNKNVTVAVRYIAGEYYGVISGDVLPIILEDSVWMESPYSEGPFYLCNYTEKKVIKDKSFESIVEATESANMMNMSTFGVPTYTVVDTYGLLVDNNGIIKQGEIIR